MTISPTTTNELTIDQIVRQAYVKAGLLSEYQQVDNTKGMLAKQLLDTIVKELEMEGILAKSVSFESVTLTAGTSIYTLSANTLDAFGVAMWIDPLQVAAAPGSTSNSELPVYPMDRKEWQTITSKDSPADRPLKYYCHREFAQPQVYYWPVPDSTTTGGIVRHQVHRYRADATDGAATLDYEKSWTQYFIHELAHQLSVSNQKPLDRCQYLATLALAKKRQAKLYSAERPGQRFTIGHTSGRQR